MYKVANSIIGNFVNFSLNGLAIYSEWIDKKVKEKAKRY